MKFLISISALALVSASATGQSFSDNERAYARAQSIERTVRKVNENNIRLVTLLRHYESKLGGLTGLYCSHDYNSDQSGFSSSEEWCHQGQCLEVRSTKRFDPWVLHFGTWIQAAQFAQYANHQEIAERKKEIHHCIATSAAGLQCKLSFSSATCYGGGERVVVNAPDNTPRERVSRAVPPRQYIARPVQLEQLPRPRPVRRPILPNAAPDTLLHP